MKYENPTCEIVLLERADCMTASGDATSVKTEDTPWVDLTAF